MASIARIPWHHRQMRDSSRLADVRVHEGTSEEELWRALYERNVGWVLRMIARLGISELDREDLAQRAFELAFRRKLGPEEVGPFLRGTVVNLVRNHRRWSRVRVAGRWLASSLFGERSVAPHAALETRTQIQLVLSRLPDPLRDVMVLADVEDVAIEEVAAILRIPLNTARWRRTQAREKFRALWREMEGAHDG
jgi:RNA polymerase sigma factor (sigma-70 family)